MSEMTREEAVTVMAALCHHADIFRVQVCCGNGRPNGDNTGEDCCGEPYSADRFYEALAALQPWRPIAEAPSNKLVRLQMPEMKGWVAAEWMGLKDSKGEWSIATPICGDDGRRLFVGNLGVTPIAYAPLPPPPEASNG